MVAISQAAADFVHRLAGREVPVVHRGVHAARLQAADADERGARVGCRARPVVAFVGRLIDGKGVGDLLERVRAAATARRRCCAWSATVHAAAELEATRERSSAIAEQVHFLGYLPEARAWAVMRASDVLVNPSYTEGLPTSVLEAAVIGKAVLATDVGGTREIVTDGRERAARSARTTSRRCARACVAAERPGAARASRRGGARRPSRGASTGASVRHGSPSSPRELAASD